MSNIMSSSKALHALESIAHRYASALMAAASETYSTDVEKASRQAKTDLSNALQVFLAAQAAPAANDAPELWAVMAECGQGVIFDDKEDARWTLTGEGTGSDGIGVPTIGFEFRDRYEDQELTLHRVHLEPVREGGAT
jgi:hypothetical protein